MNRLPLEIVHRILEYDGRIKYRHGKYMNQIAQDDVRYEMLKQMPQIKPFPNYIQSWYMSVHGSNKQCFFEKYETLWFSEKPHIHVYNTNEIGVSYFKIQDICYKFTILRQRKPTLFSHIIKCFYDLCAVNSYKYVVI
jgi:hypothetical protein